MSNSRTATSPHEERVAVLGAGIMGARIVSCLVTTGHAVVVCDRDQAALDRLVRKTSVTGPTGRVRTTVSTAQGCVDATFVIEAVSEDLDVKAAVIAEATSTAPGAVLASNTSTFQPSELAPFTSRPDLLLVTHFFNPADVVPLVEIVPSPLTSVSTLDRATALMESMGKRPIRLLYETKGFVANRLQAALLREALHLIESGVADHEQIDDIVTHSLGPRWSVAGPFRIADLGGLDVFTALSDRLFSDLAASSKAPMSLTSRVEQQSLGVKSGSGFYTWTPSESRRWIEAIAEAFEHRSTP